MTKMMKYALYAGAAYLVYKSGALKSVGLGDDLSTSLPSDINVPVSPWGYSGYGYPYQYGGFGPLSYGYGYGQGGYPYGYGENPFEPGYGGYGYGYGPGGNPGSPGYYLNPYGGQSYGGFYNPKVVTPSGGFDGLNY